MPKKLTTIAYTLALKNVKTNPVLRSNNLSESRIRDVGCPAMSAIKVDTCNQNVSQNYAVHIRYEFGVLLE
jgi:hypothetical protein